MKNKLNIHVVIMAGGSGSRFWPFSTPEKPKQFLDLTGEGSMLELTVKRLTAFVDVSKIWIITGRRYIDLCSEQIPSLPKSQIIGEPMPRDTSAAIALGAGMIEAKEPGSIMVVLPADHIIKDIKGFVRSIQKATELAGRGDFVTIGVKPTYPAEGYGYLQRGEATVSGEGYVLKSFEEKPSREKAEKFMQSGEYYWNAGMFIWKTKSLLTELEKHLPEHASMARDCAEGYGDSAWFERAEKIFEKLKKVSIDYGLMEKLSGLSMVEAEFDWNDVGGWLALEDLIEPDGSKNTIMGKCVHKDSHNNIIVCENDDSPIVVSGIKDSVIVNAKSGTLICHKNEIERIKTLIEQL